MPRRRKNAGKGFGMMFHGAFGSKEEAKKKERKVHGFIQPRNIRGERRYVVMSERKNPIRRKKSSENPVFFDSGIQKYTATRYDKKFGNIYASGYTKKEALKNLRDRLRQYRKGGMIEAHRGYGHDGENPMDLMVMGANPHREDHEIAERLKEIDRIEQMEKDGIITKKEKFEYLAALRKARAHHRGNPPREVTVHPGETITLKVNPSAEVIREEFTGREYEYTFVSTEPHMPTGDYAKLGDMMAITYKPVAGGQVQVIGWYERAETLQLKDATEHLVKLTDAPVLVSDETRRQLYFVGGNQDVSPLGVGELGEARTIVYREKKSVEDFRLVNWVHEFGEEGGKRPHLFYDEKTNRLLLEGGDYEVRPEGIRN